MKKSARILGQEYGLTAQEMNFALKEEGYLDGDPGNYVVTDKGKDYAEEKYNSSGTGGYSWYNRSWITRNWDDEIKDELDITDDRKSEIREAISKAKQKIKESHNEQGFSSGSESYSNDEGFSIGSKRNSNKQGFIIDSEEDDLVQVIIVLLYAATAYGAYRAVPYVMGWWKGKALPRFNELKNRILPKNESENR